jgi:hypothetical protein
VKARAGDASGPTVPLLLRIPEADWRRHHRTGDIAEVEGNWPTLPEVFDRPQTEAAIVWSGSGVWLGLDPELVVLLKLHRDARLRQGAARCRSIVSRTS